MTRLSKLVVFLFVVLTVSLVAFLSATQGSLTFFISLFIAVDSGLSVIALAFLHNKLKL